MVIGGPSTESSQDTFLTCPKELDTVMVIGVPSTLTESSRDTFVGVGEALTDDVICNSISCNVSQNRTLVSTLVLVF